MKFLSLIFGFMLFMSVQTKAQVITSFTGSDTIVNTATVNCDLILRNAYTSGAFQVVNTKVSGTVAGNTTPYGNGGAVYQSGFSKSAIITGLSPATTYWFDLSVFVSANTGSVVGTTCMATEF